jgi:hypothetical protein
MALVIRFLCFGLILESHNKKPVLDLAAAQRASQAQTGIGLLQEVVGTGHTTILIQPG